MAEHGYYFLSKSDLLAWINDTLGTRLTKIEETASGAIACQLMDALNPGTVPLKKVDFNAKNEYDMINNYKVLQDVFNKQNVAKHIEVAKLIKARPLDNIEFMQWLKSYFDSVTNGQAITDYDGAGRRAQSKTGELKSSGPGPSSKLATASNGRTPSQVAAAPRRAAGASAVSSAAGPASSPAVKAGASDLAAQLAEVKANLDMLDKEKQFYYSKLRDIELLCQTPKINEIPILKRVEAILYAPTAEEGRQILIETQQEFAGQVFLEEDEAAAQAGAETAANLLEGSYNQ